jgi:hypothetical protein
VHCRAGVLDTTPAETAPDAGQAADVIEPSADLEVRQHDSAIGGTGFDQQDVRRLDAATPQPGVLGS